MCGIIGMISYEKIGLTMKEQGLIKELLYLDAVRGKDSTGLMSIKKKGKVNWVKHIGLPDRLLSNKDSEAFFTDAIWDVVGMFGHNRSATRGAVNVDNSHPFEEGHITLIHNGTLTNAHTFPEMRKVHVDSNMIALLLETKGVEYTLENIRGAFTLVWFDSKEEKIKVIRNDERPLYMAYSIEEEKFYFASEAPMLSWVLRRNGVKYDGMVSIKSGDLYEFDLQQCVYEQTTMELAKPIPVPVYPSYKNNNVVPYVHKPLPRLLSSTMYVKPPFTLGARIHLTVEDYAETKNIVVFKGHSTFDKSIRISFVGAVKMIDWLDDTQTVSVLLQKIRKGIHKGCKVWQYTAIDPKPVYTNVALDPQGHPRRCNICDNLIKVGSVVSRMRRGEQEFICAECAIDGQEDYADIAFKTISH